jgi:uncharacterized sulfatase
MSRKPNVIIIHTDEHNLRTLGCYRDLMTENQAFQFGKDVKVDTPNIDFLAKNGCLFNNFITPYPICQPSRATFFTGRHYDNVINAGTEWQSQHLKSNIKTFAHFFKNAGYSTNYVGKWHLNGMKSPDWGTSPNFGFDHNRYMYNRGHFKIVEETGDNISTFNWDPDLANNKNYTTDWLSNKAIQIIESNKTKPFLLTLCIPDPHDPNVVREPYNSMFNNLVFDLPRTMRKSVNKPMDQPLWVKNGECANKWRPESIKKYFGMVKCIDDNVGKIISCLKNINLLDNTILVFTSDHGDLLYEHRCLNKSLPYDCSIRVPMIIYYPNKISSKVVNTPHSMPDFTPTVLDLCGVDYQKQSFHGSSFSSDILCSDKTIERDRIVYSRTWNWIAIIKNSLKLVISIDDDPWLFDQKVDPDELINFYNTNSYKEHIKEMITEGHFQLNKYELNYAKHSDLAYKLESYL